MKITFQICSFIGLMIESHTLYKKLINKTYALIAYHQMLHHKFKHMPRATYMYNLKHMLCKLWVVYMKHVYVFSKTKKEHAIVRSILEYRDSLTIDQLPIHALMFHFLYPISSKKTLLEFFLFFLFSIPKFTILNWMLFVIWIWVLWFVGIQMNTFLIAFLTNIIG